MTNAALAIQNWVKIFNESTEKIQIKTESLATTKLPDNKRWTKTKPLHDFNSGTFSTIRKAFTIGIEAEYFLSALNPKEGTYFGLKMEPTHTTKERLVIFGETISEALVKNKSFTFQCVNRKERNEIAIVAATMLINGWTIKLDNMTVMGEPVREQKVLPEQ
jgi:hypothetical protein